MTLVQNVFDKSHQLFRQFIDTVYYLKEDREKFKSLIPPHQHYQDIVVNHYQIPYQYCFYILRHSFKTFSELSQDEIKTMVQLYSGIFDDTYQNKINLYAEQ